MLQVCWVLFLLLLPTAAFTQPGAPTWDDLWREASKKADVIWEMPLPAHRQGSPAAHAAAELHEGHQQGVALPGVVRSTPSHGIFVPRMLNWCCESCASFVPVSYCIYTLKWSLLPRIKIWSNNDLISWINYRWFGALLQGLSVECLNSFRKPDRRLNEVLTILSMTG